MNVQLIDYTGAGYPNDDHAINILIFTKSTRLEMKPTLMMKIAAMPIDQKLAELDYMSKTIPSSWEFVDYTFLITGVTRAFTHQFVRTRTASYAQQTMRVLNVDGWTYGTGPTIENDVFLKTVYDTAMEKIGDAYKGLIKNGANIEDARGVLPTNIHTNIVAKMNMRTFVEMARKRASRRTQGEYRDVLDAMKMAVLRVHPWVSLFINRTSDVVIKQLEDEIDSNITDKAKKTAMFKLLDELRKD